MESLKSTIDQLRVDLGRSPETLEDLKFVLKTISNIQDITLDVETRARDITERYGTKYSFHFFYESINFTKFQVTRVGSSVYFMPFGVSMKKKVLESHFANQFCHRYRTLRMYNIDVPEKEFEICEKIDDEWIDLFQQSRRVS